MVPWRLPIELGRPPCSGAGLRKRQARHIPAGAPGVTSEEGGADRIVLKRILAA
jgi:hypothetical protein